MNPQTFDYVCCTDTPRSSREVAAHLRRLAQILPRACATRRWDRARIKLGTLTITCGHHRKAVETIAARYEKGVPKTWTFTYPSARRVAKRAHRPSANTFLQFWEDDERDNALEYLRLYPRHTWPRPIVELLADNDYLIEGDNDVA